MSLTQVMIKKMVIKYPVLIPKDGSSSKYNVNINEQCQHQQPAQHNPSGCDGLLVDGFTLVINYHGVKTSSDTIQELGLLSDIILQFL